MWSCNGIRSKLKWYVRWRVLIGLGTIFWLLLCLTDDLRERRTNEEITNFADQFFAEEEKKMYSVMEREEPPPPLPPPVVERGEKYDLLKVVFWNIIAFLSTLCACFTLKCISSRMMISGDISPLDDNFVGEKGRVVAIRKCSSSRIPIPVVSKSSSIDIHIDSSDLMGQACEAEQANRSCPNLLGLRAVDAVDKSKEDGKTKKIWSIRIMENHCARLREEMINLQATSLKEHASITKRMDSLTREKRELSRQLSFVIKENKSLKQQIEDMLEERTLLIRRLECATKEIRSNTKSKRATMAKLDETMANAESFKSNLEQITRDKVILEDKLMILDAEYKRLKEELALYKHRESTMACKRDAEGAMPPNKEHAIDVYEVSDDNRTITSKEAGDMDEDKAPKLANTVAVGLRETIVTQTEESDFDVSRSEKDMRKVQQKLITLERSLENFKMRDVPKTSCGTQLEKCDLWPVNENDPTPLSNGRSRSQTSSRPHPQNFYGRDESPTVASAATATATAGSPPPPHSSRSASSQSICSDEQCPLEHRECADPECYARKRSRRETGGDGHRHHHRRRRSRCADRDAAGVSVQSICTEPNCALEHRECANAECFLQRTALGRHREEETASSSDTSLYHVLAKEQIMMMCQRPIRYLRTTVSDDRLSAISEKMTSAGDDSGDEFEPKRKIFTNTPEFQKFLKEILDPQLQSSDEAVRETDDSELVY